MKREIKSSVIRKKPIKKKKGGFASETVTGGEKCVK